jgi:hypothetical protein
VAVLKGDFKTAADLMRQMGPSGDTTKEDFAEWPAFKEFRKTHHFLDAFKAVFDTEVEMRSVPSDVTTILSHASSSDGAEAAQRQGKAKKGRRLAKI